MPHDQAEGRRASQLQADSGIGGGSLEGVVIVINLGNLHPEADFHLLDFPCSFLQDKALGQLPALSVVEIGPAALDALHCPIFEIILVPQDPGARPQEAHPEQQSKIRYF